MRRTSLLVPMLLAAGCAADPSSAPSTSDPARPTPPPSSSPDGAGGGAPADDGSVRLLDVSTDGVAIFTRAGSLVAFDVVAQQETTLAHAFGPHDRAMAAGRVVAFWTGVDDAGIGTLETFSRARGKTSHGAGSVAGLFAASTDGARVAFTTHATDTDGQADIAIDDAVALQDVRVGAGASACAPMLAWLGARLLTATCAAGESAPTIRAIDGPSTVTLLPNAQRTWALDEATQRVLVIDASGKASVRSVSGGPAVAIDRDVVWGRFSADGGTVLYRTKRDELKRAYADAPTKPSTLLEGVRGVDAISPDGDWMLASESPPDASNASVLRSDVHLTPVPPGMPFIPTPTTPVDLVTTATGRALGFTSDSRRAIYLADLPASGLALGTLRVREAPSSPYVTTPPKDLEIAQGVIAVRIVPEANAIVFARARGTAFELAVTDPGTGQTTVLAEDASPAFVTTADTLVYATRGSAVLATKALR